MSGAASAQRQKELGAFYTPAPMAAKLVRWAIREPTDRALDPSFGGLVFLAEAKARLLELGATEDEASSRLFGVDLDEDAHAAALADEKLGLSQEALLDGNFFAVQPDQDLSPVEAVVGNPPYIAFWRLNGDGDAGRKVAENAGVSLTRLASSWAPFVVHGTSFVAPGGRMAQVLPAEVLHAQYADEVLAYLRRSFRRVVLVLFEQRIFPGALEEIVLLLTEGRGEAEALNVEVVECQTLDDLKIPELMAQTPRDGRRPATGGGAQKLLARLLPDDTFELYADLAASTKVSRLGGVASVDIGAVTGANDFFLVDATEAARLPPELLRPTVSKAVHVRGARLTTEDYERLLEAGVRCQMFVADKDTPDALVDAASGYLRRGQREKLHRRYKCRVREPWWGVPLPKHGAPDLLMTYCSSEHPRLLVNEAGALHTNTLHGVSLRNGLLPAPALAAAFYNSLTLLSAELVGRSYGGGVLKLEPTEAENLLLPPIPLGAAEQLPAVDEFVRGGEVAAAVERMDQLLLVKGLGLTEDDVVALHDGAERLRARRRARGKAPATAPN